MKGMPATDMENYRNGYVRAVVVGMEGDGQEKVPKHVCPDDRKENGGNGHGKVARHVWWGNGSGNGGRGTRKSTAMDFGSDGSEGKEKQGVA